MERSRMGMNGAVVRDDSRAFCSAREIFESRLRGGKSFSTP